MSSKNQVALNPEKWTLLQALTITLCFLLMGIDGADVVIVSLAAPTLIELWGTTDAAYGMVFSVGLVGIAAGSMLLAPQADRIGRKPLLAIATAVIGISTVLSGLATGLTQLILLRAVTGVGIGAILATSSSMASEFAPKKYVAAAVMMVMAGYPTGAAGVSMIANYLIPNFGWQSLFFVAGACSLVLLPIIYFVMPESMEFMLARQAPGDLERVNTLRAKQNMPALTELPPKTKNAVTSALPVFTLLKSEYRKTTLLSWAAFMGAFFTVYFLLSWIPRVTELSGYSPEIGRNGSSLFNWGAVVGLFLVGWFTAKWNLGKVIATLYIIATISMIMFAQWNQPVAVYYILLTTIGLFQQSGNGAMYAAVTQFYDTRMKTAGIGWAIGMGRVGAVLGPAAGGYALSAGLNVGTMFVLFSLPMIITAACIYTLGKMHFASNEENN
jgi:AAHS family 4-hydroxybenzoate transporter-like MFS transporter